MAEQKRITELTEDTAPTANDVVPVTDVETNTTKKVKLSNLSQGMGDVVHKTGDETVQGTKTFTGTIVANKVGDAFLKANPNGLPINQVKKEVAENRKVVNEETWTQDTANNRGMRWSWYDDVDGILTGTIRSKSLWGYTTDINGEPLTFEQFLSVSQKIDNIKRFTVNAVLSADNYNVVSGQKNAGDYIELDGIRLTMSSSGNRSFGIMTASGSVVVDGTTRAIDHTGANLFSSFASVTVSTSFVYFNSAWSMGAVGNVQEAVFYNNTNGHFYKATGIVGPSYTPCRLRLERLD